MASSQNTFQHTFQNTSNQSFHAVLFDLDGTLLNTTQAIYESLKHTIRHFTGTTPGQEELHPYMGLPILEQFSLLLPGKETEACDLYETHNLAIHKEYVKPYPGAVRTLQKLKANGVKIALVTSKKRKTAVVGLEIAGIGHLFDATVFCDDTSENKPHPAPVLKALELLGYIKPLRTFRVLMVGDSPWDINAARNAQHFLAELANDTPPSRLNRAIPVIQTAGVTYGAYAKESIESENPDYVLDSISQVLDLCGLER